MRWWPRIDRASLAFRLSAGFAVAFVSLVAGYAGLQLLLAERFSGYVTRLSMQGQVEDVLEGLQLDTAGRVVGVSLGPTDAYGYDAFFANLKFRVLDADGAVVASSEARSNSLLPEMPLDAQRQYFGARVLDGVAFQVGAWRREVNGQALTVQLARSDRFAELAREAISPAVLETAGLLATLSAILFPLVGVLAIRGVLRPIRVAVAAAGRVGQSNLEERLPEAGMPSEIRPLLHAFNAVLNRLQTAFDEQQRFFANAAHELKTPLALLRSQLDAGPVAQRDVLIAQVDAMGRRVQQLLVLAEATDRGSLRRAPTDIGFVLNEALRHLTWKAERQHIALRYLPPPEAVVRLADEGGLFVVVKNLLENAIDFSPPHDVVSARLTEAGFSVEDHGPGVAPADRQRVFERFWRAPLQQRDGAGLGLALCLEIVRAHGWTIECGEAAGGGARFEVRWPTA